jgi:hypothetical protein
VIAWPCRCTRPRVFVGEDTCQRCGHTVPLKVMPSTWRIALAIAAVALGQRRSAPGGDRRSDAFREQ